MKKDPRIPAKIMVDLREKLERQASGDIKLSKNQEAIAFEIQRLQHEMKESIKFHIRGVVMTPPPQPTVQLLD